METNIQRLAINLSTTSGLSIHVQKQREKKGSKKTDNINNNKKAEYALPLQYLRTDVPKYRQHQYNRPHNSEDATE